MNDLASFGVVVLAGAVHASLQLSLASLLLLYHESAGRHIRRKTRSLVGSFVSGIGIIILLLMGAGCFVITNIAGGALRMPVLIVCVSVLVTSALVVWFLYYRRGQGTRLWVPRMVSRFIDQRARVTENNTEAFSLGVLTTFAELPFAVVLLLLTANSVLELPAYYQLIAVATYTVIAVLPLVVVNLAIRTGQSVVDVQRWRVRNKVFLKIVSGSGFLVLGLFVVAFKIVGI